MEGKTAYRYNALRVTRNKGILGQEALYIKNEHCIWSLRCTEDKLLGRCSLDKGQHWTDWIELVSDYNGFFSFTISDIEKLHITCKLNRGYLVYVCWHGDKASTDILDRKWVEDERITYQNVLVDNSGTPHITYFTDNPLEEIWRVKFCFKGNGQWNPPEVIDHGLGPGQNQGAVILDREGTIHLVYQVSTRSKYQLVYRARPADTGRWTEPTHITDSDRSNLYPCLVADEAGTLHLTWTRSDGMNYRVIYRRKTRGGWMVGGWQKEQFLSLAGVNAYTPTVGVWEDRVVVFWQQIEGIYQCTSLDGGSTFNDPVLKDQYQKLLRTNFLALDLYKKQGLNTTATFDTGSTAVALLATVFQDGRETDEYSLALPETQDLRPLEPMLPSLEYLSLDYGQKGLGEHMRRIDGSFRRLFFEVEDSRLTNAQMKETILDQNEQIQNLEADLEKKVQELGSLEILVKSLMDKISQANGKIKALEKDKRLLENKLQSLNEENAELKGKLEQKKNAINQLREKEMRFRQQLDEQAGTILELEQNSKIFKQETEILKNTPFWKQIFR